MNNDAKPSNFKLFKIFNDSFLFKKDTSMTPIFNLLPVAKMCKSPDQCWRVTDENDR